MRPEETVANKATVQPDLFGAAAREIAGAAK